MASPPPPESPARKMRSQGMPSVEQRRVDGRGVLGPGRVGELGSEPVVGDEDGATGLPAHLRGEERVHVRRRTDVATSVQIEHDPLGRLLARHVEDPGHAAEFGGTTLDVEGAHDGRHDPLADVVEHQLERAELGDAQRRGITHEGADDLPGHGDAQVGERRRIPGEGTAERHAGQRGGEVRRQQRDVQRHDRRRCRLHLRAISHCHVRCQRSPSRSRTSTPVRVRRQTARRTGRPRPAGLRPSGTSRVRAGRRGTVRPSNTRCSCTAREGKPVRIRRWSATVSGAPPRRHHEPGYLEVRMSSHRRDTRTGARWDPAGAEFSGSRSGKREPCTSSAAPSWVPPPSAWPQCWRPPR